MKIERLKALFYYKDGKLFNKISRGSAKKDDEAGYIAEDGYLRVRVDGKYLYIHRIVWAIMNLKDIPEDLCIDHIDGNRQNNNLDILRWVTHGNNIKHSFDLNNRSATGTDNANNIFDVSVVVQICELLQSGLMPAAVRDLGYNYYLVRSIRSRKNWTHISKNYSW